MKMSPGERVVSIDRITDITFLGDHKLKLAREEFRNVLTLKLDWAGNKPVAEADVGMMYLQKGIRWIPGYKISIDGKDTATVTLQATILNEMTDLDDVTAHLVVGVPSFAFKDTLDPIGLQQAAAQLSQYFQQGSQTAYAFSNAIMTQTARMGERQAQAGEASRPPDLGPELAGSDKAEDLFLWTVKHITLKKGQRMVLPIGEYKVPYKDVYTLDIPFAPPPEVRQQLDNARQAELARLFTAPKVIHKVRLTNKSEYPFTTAPALLVKDDRVLAQGMMTYTAVGASSELDLTTAVDVQVKKSEMETKRTPNAETWQNKAYARTDLEGHIALTNYGKEAIEIKVTRWVLGTADEADHDGQVEKVNQFEEGGSAGFGTPAWWGWYSWPGWWTRFNGIGRITWDVKLETGKSIDLKYTWHYFWQ